MPHHRDEGMQLRLRALDFFEILLRQLHRRGFTTLKLLGKFVGGFGMHDMLSREN